MTMTELIRKYEIENIRYEGYLEGIEQGIELASNISKLHRKGYSAKLIAKEVNYNEGKIKKFLINAGFLKP